MALEDTAPEGVPSVCLRNELEDGVCMPKWVMLVDSKMYTCFVHRHCETKHRPELFEDRLCSGRGLCEKPRVSVHNRMPAPASAEVQVFSNGCTKHSTFGLSQFEGVEDFATSNGMCGARRRFSYKENVENTLELERVGRSNYRHTTLVVDNRDELADESVLRAKPHACDRSYQHTELGVCASDSSSEGPPQVREIHTSGNTRMRNADDYVWALQTWKKDKDHGGTSVRFCNIRKRSNAVGFLSPYGHFPVGGEYEDTLKYVPQTILDCNAFETCPTIGFKVNAEPVYRHVFRIIKDIKDSTNAERTWSNVDGDVCFGQGYRVQDKDLKLLRKCVVDRSTVPLLTVLFGKEDADEHLTSHTFCSEFAEDDEFCDTKIKKKFERLRGNCVNAFGIDEATALFNFHTVMHATTREYNHDQRRPVLNAVNDLLPQVFNIDAAGVGRGFKDILEYLQHAKCARFIIKRLHEVQEKTPKMRYQRDVPAVDEIAGTSLYFFQDRAAVYMPFRWFWQCVVLDESPNTGAPTDWLQTLANPAALVDSLYCQNYNANKVADEDSRGGFQHTKVSIRTLLRQSRHIFGESDGLIVSEGQGYIHTDIENIVDQALSAMKLTSIPNVQCVKDEHLKSRDEEVIEDIYDELFPNIYVQGINDYKTNGLLNNMVAEGDNFIKEDVRKYLWRAGTSDEDGDYSFIKFTTLSTDDMKNKGMMTTRELSDEVHEDALIVPEMEFTGLNYDYLKDRMPKRHIYPWIKEDKKINKHLAGEKENEYAVEDLFVCAVGLKLVEKEYGVLDVTENINKDENDPPSVKFVPQMLLGPMIDPFMQGKAFFTRNETLYLVLQYMRVHLPLNPTMHADKLVAVKTSEVRSSMRLQANGKENTEYLHSTSLQFDLGKYQRYNREMEAKTYECDEFFSINYDAVTNDGFQELGECYKALQVKTGWVVPHSEYLRLELTAEMMTQGFFVAFAAQEKEVYGEFVDNMTSSRWAEDNWRGENRYQKCFSRAGQPELMNPALPGVFDTDISCETARDADGLWTVDSACDEQCKEKDPDLTLYGNLSEYLPADCESRHGTIISRHQRLNRPYHTPVCEKRFQPQSVCTRAHGILGGRKGTSEFDLYQEREARIMTGGLWENAAFLRGFDSDNVTDAEPDDRAYVLRLLSEDIGGHALEFAVIAVTCCRLRSPLLRRRSRLRPLASVTACRCHPCSQSSCWRLLTCVATLVLRRLHEH